MSLKPVFDITDFKILMPTYFTTEKHIAINVAIYPKFSIFSAKMPRLIYNLINNKVCRIMYVYHCIMEFIRTFFKLTTTNIHQYLYS